MTMRTIPFGKPVIGEEERQAVHEVLKGDILVHGPKAKEFEEAFRLFVGGGSPAGGGHAVSVSSCTAALHLSYFYLEISPGDEVIVPAQTHTATAHAVELCGAKPVFVDAELKTGNIDLNRIEEKITPRTRALSVVHFLGMPVDMEKITVIAKRHDLFVVEDCALAMGTTFKKIHAGLHGDVGCFSFYPVKHMTTAEGGMLITRHEKVARKIARQKAFGVDRPVGERALPGFYDVTMLGLNYRLNEIQSAIGIEQLKKLPLILKKRRENYEMLSRGLRDIEDLCQFQSTGGDYQSSYYCLSVLLNGPLADKRAEMITGLKQRGVGTSIYYPQPVPLFTYYKNKYGADENSYPVAAKISRSSIALPVGVHLTGEDIAYIVQSVKETIHEVK